MGDGKDKMCSIGYRIKGVIALLTESKVVDLRETDANWQA